MSFDRRVLTFIAALATVLATAAPAAAEPHIGYASETETRWDRFTTAPELAEDAHRLGFRSQIVIVDWEFIQRDGPAAFNWTHYDKVRDAFAARGIRPLFEVAFTPKWAADPQERERHCGPNTSWRVCGYRLPPAREHLGAWRTFVTALMDRYADWRPLGVAVWNEPNSLRYWKTGPDAARYLELVHATKEGVLAAGSEAPVMTALSPARDSDTIAGEYFLHQLYTLGARDVIDAIGTNLYASTNRSVEDPKNWFNTYLLWLRYVRWFHGADEDIWINESGYFTQRPSNAPACQADWVTEAFQADQLARAIHHVRTMPDIGSYFIHQALDTGSPDSCNREHHFGLRRFDLSRKPAWYAVRNAVGAR